LPGDPAKLYNDAYSVSNDAASAADSTAASSTFGPVLPQPKDHIHLLQLLSTSVMALPDHLLYCLTVALTSLGDTLPYYPKDATPRPSINSLVIHSLEPSAVTNK